MLSITKENIFHDPFKHIFFRNFLDKQQASTMLENFPDLNDKIWDNKGKLYDTAYGKKKELTDIASMHSSYREFFNLVFDKQFIDQLSEFFKIPNLFGDEKLYGGGLNIYESGSKLDPHIDFNYNNELEAYRAINLLYYLNPDWSLEKGGNLQLYSSDEILVKEIVPELNCCVAFASNNKTLHGVSEIVTGERKSIGLWYYSKIPPADVSKIPSKTKWLNMKKEGV